MTTKKHPDSHPHALRCLDCGQLVVLPPGQIALRCLDCGQLVVLPPGQAVRCGCPGTTWTAQRETVRVRMGGH
jgi:ribosomal protein S27E